MIKINLYLTTKSQVDKMVRKVMVASVGFEFDRVVDAQKFESCNAWYILRNPKGASDAVGEHSVRFGERVVEKVMSMNLLDYYIVDVRQSDLLGLVREMATIVREERVKDLQVEFVFNVSSSTKTAQYAATLVAGWCPSPVKLLYLRPLEQITLMDIISNKNKIDDDARQRFLEHGECHSPFEAEYFPIMPFVTFTPAERAILIHLANVHSVETVSSLVQIIMVGLKKQQQKDLVRVGWSVNKLERMHLVTSKKVKQSRIVNITSAGDIVAAALGMLDIPESNV